MVETWDDLLDELIDEPEFKSSIEENGFYKSDTSLNVFTKKYNFQPLQNTAVYLSIDFWSKQSNVLRRNDFFLLRIGGGKFGIFDQKKFPKPYLDLSTNDSVKLDLVRDDDFKDLIEAFDTRQENAGLEHLNVTGVYDSLITELFGKKKMAYWPKRK